MIVVVALLFAYYTIQKKQRDKALKQQPSEWEILYKNQMILQQEMMD